MRHTLCVTLLLASLSALGCRGSQGTYDYAGPMIGPDGNMFGFFDRRNSILSPDPSAAYVSAEDHAKQQGEPFEELQPTEEAIPQQPTQPTKPKSPGNRTASRSSRDVE